MISYVSLVHPNISLINISMVTLMIFIDYLLCHPTITDTFRVHSVNPMVNVEVVHFAVDSIEVFDFIQGNCQSVEDYVIAMTEMKVTELFVIGNSSVSSVPFGSHVWPTLTHYSIAGQSVVLLIYERSLSVINLI